MTELETCPVCKIYRNKGINKKCDDCQNDDIPSTPGLNANEVKRLKTIGIMSVGAVGAVGLAAVIVPVLGFTAAGVAAGSVAAGIQSSIGSVAAGSLFATLQSVGAVGLSSGATAIIGGIGAIGAGAINKIVTKDGSKEEKNGNEANGSDTMKNKLVEGQQNINVDHYNECSTEELINWIMSLDPDSLDTFEHKECLMKHINSLINNKSANHKEEEPLKAYI